MKISGFSFVRNGVKLYYPIREAIESILPICDEVIVAVGKGDADDRSREEIASIGDPKIRIIDTEWDEKYFKRGIINSIQTDITMKECTGDWLLYVQADEVIHEEDHAAIRARCEELLDDQEVEGLLFDYYHFWGDYNHYHRSHGWYPHEIRIVRNRDDIHSFESAQSFRSFDYYDNPRQPDGTHKLKVAKVDAHIYHYGWVRPPHLMQNKRKAFDNIHKGIARSAEIHSADDQYFDYGPLNRLTTFEGTHPIVMKDRIARLDWQDKLQYSGKPKTDRLPHKHEKLKYRLLTALERTFTGGRQIGGFRNYILLKDR